MPKTFSDYSNTIIYKLCCKDPAILDIYIGHTTNFIQRKNQHKTSCLNETNPKYNQYVYQFIRENGGWDNWSIIQIESVNCKDKREAESIEQYWIEQLSAKLNSNKPYALCTENPKIYKQDWYQSNKEEIKEKAKQNYQKNKELKLEYQSQYAVQHKEEIANYQKQYRELNKEKIAEQKKIYREANKEIAKIKQKEWNEANKDKLKEKKAQIIECECGHSFSFGNKNRHFKTKVHLQNIHISNENELLDVKN